MTRAIGNVLSRAVARASWLLASEAPRDVIVVLSEALRSEQSEIDCEGEVSIIVLPIADDANPAFVLYQKEGVARVATVAGDEWKGDQGFASFQEAVASRAAEVREAAGPRVTRAFRREHADTLSQVERKPNAALIANTVSLRVPHRDQHPTNRVIDIFRTTEQIIPVARVLTEPLTWSSRSCASPR